MRMPAFRDGEFCVFSTETLTTKIGKIDAGS
jgi:hypothetical protein